MKDGPKPSLVLQLGERCVLNQTQRTGSAVEERRARTRGIVPSPVEESIGLVRMFPERPSPPLGKRVISACQPRVSADPGKTGRSQVDQREWPFDGKPGERAGSQLGLGDDPDANTATEGLDECAVEIATRVEHAVLAVGIVEATAAGAAKVECLVPGPVATEPILPCPMEGQRRRRQMSRRFGMRGWSLGH